ncbi:MAG: DUF4876 domain-containing protein [Tannerella sp.]|jgi:hypothetical protein|nr:DUF4876 domain-containing protein [Tannerella sp.]
MKKNFLRSGLIAAVSGIALSYASCSDDFDYESSSGQYSGLSGSGGGVAAYNPLVGDSVQQYAGLVISKIYFTGSGSSIRDQYFRISNNSDTIIDAQGVIVLESKFVCGTTAYYDFSDSISDKNFVTEVVYRIPYSTPIAPGESIILAYQIAEVPDGLDLSGANYGWTAGTPDPLLSKIFSYSATVWVLHNRGFRSYAIGALPADSTSFLANYKYTGTYKYDVHNDKVDTTYVITTTNAYKIPNEWIIDAVNVVSPVPAERVVQTLPYSLDSGLTYAGDTSNSSSTARFEKAVSRKSAGGKYVDTNNSTNDFDVNTARDPILP